MIYDVVPDMPELPRDMFYATMTRNILHRVGLRPYQVTVEHLVVCGDSYEGAILARVHSTLMYLTVWAADLQWEPDLRQTYTRRFFDSNNYVEHADALRDFLSMTREVIRASSTQTQESHARRRR